MSAHTIAWERPAGEYTLNHTRYSYWIGNCSCGWPIQAWNSTTRKFNGETRFEDRDSLREAHTDHVAAKEGR